MPAAFKLGEGLAGQASVDKRLVHVADAPESYLTVGSGTGRSKPRHIIVAPALADGDVQGVVELGFLRDLDKTDLDALARVSEMVGGALRSARDRSKLEELLAETQAQAEELQAQQEELRVTNELEEVLYLDRLQLVAIDHPKDVSVYPDEGLTETPKAERVVAVRDPRAVRAFDHRGRDVSDRLVRLDLPRSREPRE